MQTQTQEKVTPPTLVNPPDNSERPYHTFFVGARDGKVHVSYTNKDENIDKTLEWKDTDIAVAADSIELAKQLRDFKDSLILKDDVEIFFSDSSYFSDAIDDNGYSYNGEAREVYDRAIKILKSKKGIRE